MRIGISCYPSHGGSGVVATELGKHLAERGHAVAFISYASPLRLSHLPPRVCFHEVITEEYPLLKQYPYTLSLASKMVEVARSHDLQVLHAHYAIPFAAAAILARQMAPELDSPIQPKNGSYFFPCQVDANNSSQSADFCKCLVTQAGCRQW